MKKKKYTPREKAHYYMMKLNNLPINVKNKVKAFELSTKITKNLDLYKKGIKRDSSDFDEFIS